MLRYLTVIEIVALYRRPTGTVYRLASQHHWRRCPGRPALYHSADVDASMSSRHPV